MCSLKVKGTVGASFQGRGKNNVKIAMMGNKNTLKVRANLGKTA